MYRNLLICLLMATALTGCAKLEKVNHFLPAALAWFNQTEQELLAVGRPLTAEELEIAHKVGVSQPEKVRLVVHPDFPIPSDPELRREAERLRLGSDWEGGRTMGYAILLKPEFATNRTMLTHELVHVTQIDRMGNEDFLKRYLIEMELLGYENSLMEREARQVAGEAF
ncbi:hypothetical protein [Thiothrix lacustris]|uniref:hypothetical protein n=1 Tax=Thiothrix lacustris TaxID=525917 RepID=UPI00048B4434|nr:hypothetical protein [Thiothrix lacustris]